MNTQPDTVLELTPLDEFKVQTWRAQLPSGKVVRLRPMSLIAAISRGNVPNELLSAVVEIAKSNKIDLEKTNLAELMPLMIWMADQVLVDISIWDGKGEQPEGTVQPEVFSNDDYSAMFQWATTEATTPFRAIHTEQ